MGEIRSRVPPKAPRAFLPAVFILVLTTALPFQAQEAGRPTAARPPAGMSLELGVGTGGRLYYRPRFHYAWNMAPAGATQIFADLGYVQRTNDVYEGPIDYSLALGLAQRLSQDFAIEVSYDHFCRHLLSQDNPYVLNLNEAVVKLRWRRGAFNLAVGYGRFVHGTPGFEDLAVVDAGLTPFLFSGLSLESRIKWVNGLDLYYDVRLALRIADHVSLFIRTAAYYRMSNETSAGLRFSTEASGRRLVDHLTLGAEAYPRFDEHKLFVSGNYWLELVRGTEARAYVDFGFGVPFPSGDGFFTEFYPELMAYTVSAVGERKLGPLFGAVYVRASAELPADRALPFSKNFGTGLLVRNQLDFDRLEHPLRFELGAGWNDSHGYDLGLKLAVNSVFPGTTPNFGAEFWWGQDRDRTTTDLRAFAAFGRVVSIRPYVGGHWIKDSAGTNPRRKLALGLTLHTRFD